MEKMENKSYSQLLKVIWCPICFGKLTVEVVDGKRVLKCAKHGKMNCYLDKDPLAPYLAEVSRIDF